MDMNTFILNKLSTDPETCHGPHVEVKGQFARVVFFFFFFFGFVFLFFFVFFCFHHLGSGDQVHVVRLNCKYLYLLSHLPGMNIIDFKKYL
jgi:hypothetical protein